MPWKEINMARKKPPTKKCPKCGAEVHARKAVCDCGHKFRKKRVKKAAPKAAPMTKAAPKDDQISMSALIEAKKFADKLGLEQAKEAIEALGKLAD